MTTSSIPPAPLTGFPDARHAAFLRLEAMLSAYTAKDILAAIAADGEVVEAGMLNWPRELQARDIVYVFGAACDADRVPAVEDWMTRLAETSTIVGGRAQVMAAVRAVTARGPLSLLKRIDACHPSLRFGDNYKFAAYAAVQHDRPDMLHFLMDLTDTALFVGLGESLSYVAAKHGSVKCLKYVADAMGYHFDRWLDYSEDLDTTFLLDIAVDLGHVNILAFLKDKAATHSYEILHHPKTCYHYIAMAIERGQLGVVCFFETLPGIDFSQDRSAFVTAAAFYGRIDILEFLHTKPGTDFAGNSNSPVYAAAHNGHLDAVRLLYADPGVADSQDGIRRALDAAAEHGHWHVVDWLQARVDADFFHGDIVGG